MALARAFGEGWEIRTQAPIALDEASEPEPDVAVVRGGPRDYAAAHPAEPALVLEVALTSLDFDRERKSSLYACAGRPKYWIVNLVDRVLEIRRAPGTFSFSALRVRQHGASLAAPTAPARRQRFPTVVTVLALATKITGPLPISSATTR
jgi:Uma2 family endonuclease